MSVGEAIGIMAKEKGFNLRQLAAKAKVSYNTLYAIVKRKSSRVDLTTLQNVAAALEVSLDELLPFTPHLVHYGDNNTLVAGPHFDQIVTSRMLDANEREERKTAKNDALELLGFFDMLDEKGQKKAIELVSMLTNVPDYRNPSLNQKRELSQADAVQVFSEFMDLQRGNLDKKIFDLIEDVLTAHDAGKYNIAAMEMENVLNAFGDRRLIHKHTEAEMEAALSDEDCLQAFELLKQIVAAHDEGNKRKERRLILKFLDFSELEL